MTHHLIWRLRNQHRRLQQLIRAEQRQRNPDPFVIQDLKRRKLRVKDALFLAEAGPATVAPRMSHS